MQHNVMERLSALPFELITLDRKVFTTEGPSELRAGTGCMTLYDAGVTYLLPYTSVVRVVRRKPRQNDR